ncbi:MAG: VOC family protein [Caulobacteraceae bacterium]
MDQQPHRPSTGITPFLAITGNRAQEALEFYARAFAGEVVERNLAEDGKRLMQASMRINTGWIMLSDEFPEWGYKATPPASVTLHLQVDDADAWWERAVAAGCEVKMPIDNQFWGDRYGQLKDPFGHSWSIGGPIVVPSA